MASVDAWSRLAARFASGRAGTSVTRADGRVRNPRVIGYSGPRIVVLPVTVTANRPGDLVEYRPGLTRNQQLVGPLGKFIEVDENHNVDGDADNERRSSR